MAMAPLAEIAYGDVLYDERTLAWPRPVLRVVEPLDRPSRRHQRAGLQARRRRVALGALAGVVVTGLALPLSALGGKPVAPSAGSVVPDGAAVTYVVQPGDTLWSIAERFDGGGNPRQLAEELARQTGSANVVPGERIAVP